MCIFQWICTSLHGIFAVCLVLGVLFSNTPIQMAAIASCLIIILCMIRWFDGCFVTSFEKSEGKPTLSEIGIAFSTVHRTIPVRCYEEIVVANLLLIHCIKIFGWSILPLKILF